MKKPPRPAAQLFAWYAEAKLLPPPQYVGEWCITPGRCRFKVCTGTDDDTGQKYIWWELCTLGGIPLGIAFRRSVLPSP